MTTTPQWEEQFDDRFVAVKKYNGPNTPSELANHLCLEIGLPEKIKSFIRSLLVQARAQRDEEIVKEIKIMKGKIKPQYREDIGISVGKKIALDYLLSHLQETEEHGK